MIPRYQRIAFWTLAFAILLMAIFTIYERQQSHDRVNAATDAMPYIEPVNAQTESVTLDLANDGDGTILSGLRDVALPAEPSLRARALLDRLFNEYTLPGSMHPLKAGPAVDDVFLLRLPLTGALAGVQAAATAPQPPPSSYGQLAVINLHGPFVDAHPSGAIIEDLTLRSIIGTLHANLPEVTQVRFLVDGKPRETLAGHADLLKVYTAADTAAQTLQPAKPVESRQP